MKLKRLHVWAGVSLALLASTVVVLVYAFSSRVDTVEGGNPPAPQEWLGRQVELDKLPPAPNYVFNVDFTGEENDPVVSIEGQGICTSELNPNGLHIRDQAQVTVKSRKSMFGVNGRSDFSVSKKASFTMGDGTQVSISGGYCTVTIRGTGQISFSCADNCQVTVKGPAELSFHGGKLEAENSKKVTVEAGYCTLKDCKAVQVTEKGAAYCQGCAEVLVDKDAHAVVIDAKSVTARDNAGVDVYGKSTSISARSNSRVIHHK